MKKAKRQGSLPGRRISSWQGRLPLLPLQLNIHLPLRDQQKNIKKLSGITKTSEYTGNPYSLLIVIYL